MKKTAIIAGAVSLLFIAASANAQNDTVPKQPETPVTTQAPETPATTTAGAPVATTYGANDKYNNYDKAKYAMKPMPEALTIEKIFPVIGKYELTSKDGATSQVTISLDETNKGLVWIDGLPEGRIKAQLRQSPAVYKIPEQKLGEEKDAKTVAEGVLIYDKDANMLNVCVGCKYNVDDPATAFMPAEEQPADQTETKTKTKKGTTKTKTKVVKVKPVHYSGAKMVQETAVANPVPAAPQQ
jgi:hypothetical protein